MSTRTRQSKRIDEDLLYDEFDENLDLELLTDAELEEILFEDEEETKRKGPFNLPTMAGLSMIVVGIAYMLQQLGVLGGISLGAMVSWLPWLAGVLIILLGFGVLSWRPDKKKKRRAAIARRRARAQRRQRTVEETPSPSTSTSTSTSKPKSKSKQTSKQTSTASASSTRSERASRASSATTMRTTRRRSAKPKRRFRKSNDRKIAGVCGGIAEYFNLDPTLVRIAFVIATIMTQGAFFFAYPILALFMAPPAPRTGATKASKSRRDSGADERITIIKDR